MLGRNIRGRGSHHLGDQQTPVDSDGQSSPARITVSKETRHVGIEVTETSAMARNWAAGGVSGGANQPTPPPPNFTSQMPNTDPDPHTSIYSKYKFSCLCARIGINPTHHHHHHPDPKSLKHQTNKPPLSSRFHHTAPHSPGQTPTRYTTVTMSVHTSYYLESRSLGLSALAGPSVVKTFGRQTAVKQAPPFFFFQSQAGVRSQSPGKSVVCLWACLPAPI